MLGRLLLVAAVLGVAAMQPTPAARAMFAGEPAAAGSAPWSAAILGTRGGMRCGGTLIAPRRILTAGHCIDGSTPGEVRVVLGDGPPDRKATLAVRALAVAPGYRLIPVGTGPRFAGMEAAEHDAGLILLEEPVRGVDPVPLATEPVAPGTPGEVLGRGRTGDDDGPPDVRLKRGPFAVVSDADCRAAYPAWLRAATNVCAAPLAAARLCGGDSGSPLLVPDGTGRTVQAGVVSWGNETKGRGCGTGDDPESFADVAALASFIGDPAPVTAPEPRGRPAVRGTARPGGVLRCSPGRWRGAERFEYAWVPAAGDGARRVVLSGGRGRTLRPGARLVGRGVLCRVRAVNAGGSRVERFSAKRIVRP